MFKVKFFVDGSCEDEREMPKLQDALLLAAEWSREAREDYADGPERFVPDVVVEEVTEIARFFCKP